MALMHTHTLTRGITHTHTLLFFFAGQKSELQLLENIFCTLFKSTYIWETVKIIDTLEYRDI